MTTYTITESQRQQLLHDIRTLTQLANIDHFENPAMGLLQSLTTNSEEPWGYATSYENCMSATAHKKWLEFDGGKGRENFADYSIPLFTHPAPSTKPAEPLSETESVVSALKWAGSLIRKEYEHGHNGADSWLMNYSELGEEIRGRDHRKWAKTDWRWVPVGALTAPVAPAKPARPLTDTDIEAIQRSDPTYRTCSCKAFARAIEAHIKGDQA